MRVSKRTSMALFFASFGVVLPFVGSLAYECRLVGEMACLNCALYFLISGVISERGFTCRNRFCAMRMFLTSLLWTLGMCGMTGALLDTNRAHYIWGALGGVSLAAGFLIYWHALFRSKTPAMAYDYQRELTDEQAATLLDMPVRSYRRWKAEGPGRVSRDGRARLSNLMGIHKALRIIFSEATRGYAWIRAANDSFCGSSALDVMLGGELTDIMRVRRYLDAERGGW